MERPSGSHVNENGLAKKSYETRAEAAVEADMLWFKTGRPQNVYRCAQQPEHWHVGRGWGRRESERA